MREELSAPMFTEVLVALSIFGLVLAAVAEAHQTIAKVTRSANQREEREKTLLYEHFKDPSPLSNCASNIVVPNLLMEECCELELKVGDSKKSGRSCKLSPDSGSALLSFILGSFFLVILGTISYPTIRQLMIERKELKKSHSQLLSLSETESEIQRVLFDNQALSLPDTSKVLSGSSPLLRPIFLLKNINFRPDSGSSFLLTTELNLRYLALPTTKNIVTGDTIKFFTCGSLPLETNLLAGLYLDHWDFFTLTSRDSLTLPGCNKGYSLSIKKLVEENSQLNSQLFGLVPIRQSEIYYLDNNKSLRRYSLVQQRTTPVDYGYSKFRVVQTANLFSFQITKQDQSIEKDYQFTIELESTNAESFYSLLF